MYRRILVLIGVLVASNARGVFAEEATWRGLDSFGLRGLYGQANRSGIEYTSVLPRISLFLPPVVDEPLAAWNIQSEFVIEGLFSYAKGPDTSVEVGINPLMFSLRYDYGQRLVPFVEGGEGLLYHDLHGQDLGNDFEFSSQAGGGAHWFLDGTTALTLSYRIRHISNAGITEPNRGLNTDNVTFGITVFPKR